MYRTPFLFHRQCCESHCKDERVSHAIARTIAHQNLLQPRSLSAGYYSLHPSADAPNQPATSARNGITFRIRYRCQTGLPVSQRLGCGSHTAAAAVLRTRRVSGCSPLVTGMMRALSTESVITEITSTHYPPHCAYIRTHFIKRCTVML
jgi:hypothetical protein